MPAALPQVVVVQDVVIEPAMLQLMRPRLRAQRIVRRMLTEMESFVDRPQLQWITEVRMMFMRESADVTRSWLLLVFGVMQ
jgi:hypothetical protein